MSGPPLPGAAPSTRRAARRLLAGNPTATRPTRGVTGGGRRAKDTGRRPGHAPDGTTGPRPRTCLLSARHQSRHRERDPTTATAEPPTTLRRTPRSLENRTWPTLRATRTVTERPAPPSRTVPTNRPPSAALPGPAHAGPTRQAATGPGTAPRGSPSRDHAHGPMSHGARATRSALRKRPPRHKAPRPRASALRASVPQSSALTRSALEPLHPGLHVSRPCTPGPCAPGPCISGLACRGPASRGPACQGPAPPGLRCRALRRWAPRCRALRRRAPLQGTASQALRPKACVAGLSAAGHRFAGTCAAGHCACGVSRGGTSRDEVPWAPLCCGTPCGGCRVGRGEVARRGAVVWGFVL
ncbi:hypothetical protein EDD29_1098 [Actinocorallia herbida]|uniref:Uncharacterized protein n=1 Tax=Actinocorallia herbida TaxID=58109 RepID=A0A3N1CQL7_9ACTN|nr:hypothetical protein EDD29_1098 [Actinocorallia herbida]